MQNASTAPITDVTVFKRSLWVGLLVLGSIGFSYIFTCATPFAALATLAALNMPRRDAFAVVGLSWLAGQIIGYGLLGFPQTWDSFAWGAAIGAAAMLGTWAALALADRMPHANAALVVAAAFLAAFAVYELALYATSFLIPGGTGGFTAAVVFQILAVNTAALAGLLVAHRLAMSIGFVSGSHANRPAVA